MLSLIDTKIKVDWAEKACVIPNKEGGDHGSEHYNNRGSCGQVVSGGSTLVQEAQLLLPCSSPLVSWSGYLTHVLDAFDIVYNFTTRAILQRYFVTRDSEHITVQQLIRAGVHFSRNILQYNSSYEL